MDWEYDRWEEGEEMTWHGPGDAVLRFRVERDDNIPWPENRQSSGPTIKRGWATLSPDPKGFTRTWTWREHVEWGQGPWKYHHPNCETAPRCEDCAELREEWEDDYDPEWKVFPVEWDEDGMEVRLSGTGLDKFDDLSTESGMRRGEGVIYVHNPPTTSPMQQLADAMDGFDPEDIARGVMEEWSTYLQGEVFVVFVEGADGECIDSLGGIEGREGVNEWIEEVKSEYTHRHNQQESPRPEPCRQAQEGGLHRGASGRDAQPASEAM